MKFLLIIIYITIAGCMGTHTAQKSGSAITKRHTFFHDYFDTNKNNWPVENNADHKFYFVEDPRTFWNYVMDNRSNAYGYDVTQLCQLRKGWKVELWGIHYSGTTDRPYGIVFGSGGEKGKYWFFINGNGQYGCSKNDHGSVTMIKNWAFSEYIFKQGDYTTLNRLKVVNNGETWDFYVNDNFLFKCNSQSFFGDEIGFRVEGEQVIRWKAFMVQMLQKTE